MGELLALAEQERRQPASGDAGWRTFAANLYAQVRGVSVSPRSLTLTQSFALVLDVGEAAEEASWGRYRPGALAAARGLSGANPSALVKELVTQAHALGVKLVFAMTSGGPAEQAVATIGGVSDGVMVVHVPHELLAQALHEGVDVECFLQERLAVAQALNLERRPSPCRPAI